MILINTRVFIVTYQYMPTVLELSSEKKHKKSKLSTSINLCVTTVLCLNLCFSFDDPH